MSHTADQQKFSDEFKAREYLENYYSSADIELVKRYVTQKTAATETVRIMMFLDLVCAPLIRGVFGKGIARVLEVGGGPTLYQLMNIVDEVREIHFTDYVEDNLREIRLWKSKDASAYSWDSFLTAALMLKFDTPKVGEKDKENLKNELREKIKTIGFCNVFEPGLGVKEESFDIINTHFVAESATSSKEEWEKALKNMYEKLNEKGLLFMSTLRGARGSYRVLENEFPAVDLYEKDLEEGLQKAGFSIIRISSIHTEEKSNNYEGFMFVVAQKK